MSDSSSSNTSSNDAFSWQVVQSLLYSGIGTTLSKVLNVVALLFVLKFISASAFGIANIVLAIFAILRAITELGLGVAIVQAQNMTRGQIDSLFWLSLAVSGGLFAILLAASPLFAWFYGEPQLTALVQVYGISIVVFSFYFVPKNLLTKEMDFGRIVFAENASLLTSSLVMIALAYYGFGAWAIIVGELGNRLGQLVLFQVFRPYWPRWTFDWEAVQSHVSFGLYATGSRLLSNFTSNIDYLIVGKAFGPEAVGVYAIAYRIISDPVRTLVSTINDVAYPAFSRLQDQLERLRTYFFTIARAGLSLIGVVLIIVAVYIGDMLVLGGYDKYLDAVPLIHVFALVGLVRCVSPLVPQLLNAVGQARLNFHYQIVSSVILPTVFLIGAQISLMGMAWSWALGYPLLAMLLFFFGSRVLETTLRKMVQQIAQGGIILIPVLATGVAVHWVTDTYLPSYPVISLAIGVLVTLATGLGLAYLRERKTIAVLRGRYSAMDV